MKIRTPSPTPPIKGGGNKKKSPLPLWERARVRGIFGANIISSFIENRFMNKVG
jgi:hypothetical protein